MYLREIFHPPRRAELYYFRPSLLGAAKWHERGLPRRRDGEKDTYKKKTPTLCRGDKTEAPRAA